MAPVVLTARRNALLFIQRASVGGISYFVEGVQTIFPGFIQLSNSSIPINGTLMPLGYFPGLVLVPSCI